jgi:hypothetical protein
MNKILLCYISLFTISCAQKSKNDSLIDLQNKIKKEPIASNIIDSSSFSSSDTIFSEESPIKIISAKILKNAYSDHKDIRITYKNKSNKTIQAINFEWNSTNSFEKPSSGKYFFIKGHCTGYTTSLIRPKQISSKVWEDFSTDAIKVTSSNAYLVVYTDGTIWKLKKSKRNLK